MSAEARADAEARREAAHARAREASWAVARVTEVRRTGVRPVDFPPSPLGGSGAASPPVADALPSGVLWGSLIHGLLEHAVRHAHAHRADLNRLARWLTVETPDLRPFIPQALDLVEDLRGAAFWSELRDAKEVHVEVPFGVRLEAGQSLAGGAPAACPTVIRGVIDLAYRGGQASVPDGDSAGPTAWRILDYKTDRAAVPGVQEASAVDAALVERHAPQLAQYSAAWERATGAPVGAKGSSRCGQRGQSGFRRD